MSRLRNIIGKTAARVITLVAVFAFFSSLCSCKKELEKLGAIYTCDEYTVYPDSLASDKISLRPEGDNMLIIRGDKVARRLLSGPGVNGAVIECSDTLLTYLFNSDSANPDSTVCLTPRYYDALTPYEIYIADAILSPDSAMALIDSRISQSGILDLPKGDYHWPVIMSDASWGVAAATVSAMMTGDADESKRVDALKRLIDRDIEYVYQTDYGLFQGMSPDMSHKQLADWMNAGDAAALMTLSGNVNRLADIRYINTVRPGSYDVTLEEGLKDEIAKSFWIPNLGMLSQTLYQRPYPVMVTAADNIAQAWAILTGSVSDEMSRRIIERTPVLSDRIPVTYPMQGVENDQRRGLITNALWAIAAARVQNAKAWDLSFSWLVWNSAGDAFARRLIRGVILRSVYGLDPQSDGLHITPFVNNLLGDSHILRGFRYGEADLEIEIQGRGGVVNTVTLDGKPLAEAVVPRTLSGEHKIFIELTEGDIVSPDVNITAIPAMPESPAVTIKGARRLEVTSTATESFIVYINGAIEEIIDRNSYELYEAAPVSALSFEADVSNYVTSYASRNYMYIPARDSVSIPCTSVAQTGGRLLAVKDLAARYVESTRFKNARLRFNYESSLGGRYYIRLRYLDGLGVVNKNRRYALRLLKVNGEHEGVLVLSQRGPEMWTPDRDWSTMQGVTLPVETTFKKGNNVVEIEYFMPDEGEGADHDANIVIPVALEIIKVP